MSALSLLVPVSIVFGLIGLSTFFWALGRGQFDDPQGDAERILLANDRPLIAAEPPLATVLPTPEG